MRGLLLLSGATAGVITILCILVVFLLILIALAVKERKMRSGYKKLNRKISERESAGRFSRVFKRLPTLDVAKKLFGKNPRQMGAEYIWTWRSVKRNGRKAKIVAVSEDGVKITGISLIEPKFAKNARVRETDSEELYGDATLCASKSTYDSFLEGMTPDEFFAMRKRTHSSVTGVYVLYNVTKNMYYVGQSGNVFNRVNNHLTGKGNGDVYADYKSGDEFSVKIVSLTDSGLKSLDDLERALIERYGAFSGGYNKTRGNGTAYAYD
ncbi:MAG: GIY-YIG nuclease family protein [Clostridia bacterium]|nr:GIY-YIG nuclease family protein [Clostridia bacterium]